VLPVHAETKRPLTRHGVLDASADPAWVIEQRWPAIATPTGNGLLVIDIDPRNGGSRQPWMPDTREVRTQSGGTHLHYRIDEDVKSRANLFGPGLDSKCAGGYVLIPPSPGYAWVADLPPAPMCRADLERQVDTRSFPSGATGGAARKAPEEWRRGMIHDQVIAWASFMAHDSDDALEVQDSVWELVHRARAAGCRIDNAGNHINSAIRWVMDREAASTSKRLR
jgi:hypothetical protein